MRSLLVLRSPSHGTGWQEQWIFTGDDERILRDYLAALDAYRVAPPSESWHLKRGHVIEGQRWRAAMLLHADEASTAVLPPPAEAAWTAEGAARLAETLPERFDDLRAALRDRFTDAA